MKCNLSYVVRDVIDQLQVCFAGFEYAEISVCLVIGSVAPTGELKH